MTDDSLHWLFDHSRIDWDQLAELYPVAPLGDKQPGELKTVFSNSMYKCLAQKRFGDRRRPRGCRRNRLCLSLR